MSESLVELVDRARARWDAYDSMWNAPPDQRPSSELKMTIAAVQCADMVPLLIAEVERLTESMSLRR